MTGGKKLQLGTAALQAQAGPIEPAPITSPAELRIGLEVWVYFRRWQRGTVLRVIEHNPRKVRRGVPLGPTAVIRIGWTRGVSLRRRVNEVIPADSDQPPSGQDRVTAKEFARLWWDEQSRLRLVSSSATNSSC